MIENAFKLYPVSIRALTVVLESASIKPSSSLSDISKLSGYNARTTKHALSVLITLRLVSETGDGVYICTDGNVKRGHTDDHLKQLIRKALTSYRQLETMCEGISLGENVEKAVNRARILIGEPTELTNNFDILVKWGLELELLEKTENDELKLSRTINHQAQEELSTLRHEDIESEAKARLFNTRRLGRSVNDYLEDSDRTLLASSLLTVFSNPEDSALEAGQVLEDFLRKLATDKGYGTEATKCNGPSQLGNLLASKKLVHPHHQKLIDVVATFRSVTAHNKDKRTLVHWDVTQHGSYSAIMLTLLTVRSIYEYIDSGRQEL